MKSKISNSDWQDLFEALIGQSNFTVVEEKNRALQLKTKDPSLSKKLQHILSSPTHIKDNLKFALKKTGTSPSLEEKNFEICSTGPFVDSFNIFNRLLEYSGPKLKKSLVFDWDVTSGLDYLAEDLSEMPELVLIRKAAINMLYPILKKLNYAQLRAVLPRGNFKPSSVDKESKIDGPMAAMIEKILFFDEFKQSVVFDYNLFITCLTPPKVQIQENSSDAEYQILFPSALQLLNYLRTAVGANFIIKADNEEKTGHMIILGDVSTTTRTISKPNHFHYALDCSQSMNWQNDEKRTVDETLFPQVLKISKEIVDKIEEVATPSTQFSIYPIKSPSETITWENYKIKDAKALEKCQNFLDLLKADSSTNLYGVFLKIFQSINENREANHIVVGVTDGEDQNQQQKKEILFNQLTEVCRSYETSTTPPQVFIVTIGRNVAIELTEKLSIATQATVIEVEKHEQLAQLFDYFRQMHLPMKVVTVLIKMQEEIRAQERVSLFTGHPKSLRHLIVGDGETVEFEGAAYTVSRKSSLKNTLSNKIDNLWMKAPHPANKDQNTVTEYSQSSRRHSYP